MSQKVNSGHSLLDQSNICLYPLSHYTHITNDYLSKLLLCQYFVKAPIVIWRIWSKNNNNRLMTNEKNQPLTVIVSFCVSLVASRCVPVSTCPGVLQLPVLPCRSVTGHHLVSWAVAAHQLPAVERERCCCRPISDLGLWVIDPLW